MTRRVIHRQFHTSCVKAHSVHSTAPSPACAPADLSGDGQAAVGDVLQVLAKFGLTGTCGEPADVDGDCMVSVADVLLVLSCVIKLGGFLYHSRARRNAYPNY